MNTDPNDGIPIFADEEAARLVAQDFDHRHNEAGRYAYDAMQCGFTAEELDGYETISQGQADDLKHETADGLRYWLSRTGVADGEPFENTVTIEIGEGGRWRTVCKYDGGECDPLRIPEPEDEEAGYRGSFALSIALGNEAMREPEHVSAALRSAAQQIEDHARLYSDRETQIRDLNGNRVGGYRFEEAV